MSEGKIYRHCKGGLYRYLRTAKMHWLAGGEILTPYPRYKYLCTARPEWHPEAWVMIYESVTDGVAWVWPAYPIDPTEEINMSVVVYESIMCQSVWIRSEQAFYEMVKMRDGTVCRRFEVEPK
jgi:hypothetical protein